jgi:hypothetical protein
MGDTMSATRKQVIENGKLVAGSMYEDGSSDEFYILGKNLYCMVYNADGYFAGMWCMGYAKKAAKDYGININF